MSNPWNVVRSTLKNICNIDLELKWWKEWWCRSTAQNDLEALTMLLYQDFRRVPFLKGFPLVDDCTITSRHIFQLNEIENISQSLLEQSKAESASHMPTCKGPRKLCLTDGVRDWIAIEHSPCVQLDEGLVPGAKVLIENVRIRNRVLLLNDSCMTVLGGSVAALDAQHTQKRKKRAERFNRTRMLHNLESEIEATPCTGAKTISQGQLHTPEQTSPSLATMKISQLPVQGSETPFIVSAEIISLLPPLSVMENQFVARAYVDDGESVTLAYLSSPMIEALMYHRPAQFLKLETYEADKLRMKFAEVVQSWGKSCFKSILDVACGLMLIDRYAQEEI